ncbi:type VII secretion protein EccB [Streptomyces sp. NPDC091209]|uniref:type VII secretion protein EccB n=1 Tax=Streptomyces sp. NPDC091209 TaxID=3365974 RepID=UPI0037F404FA
MQTRRDHLHAHRFAIGRLATALVSGDTGRGDSPTRRASLGTFFGAGVVLLLCAGSAAFGLLSPAADTSWRRPGSIVVEQQTGNRYLFLGGTLRPVRNYASALLLAGQGAAVRSVSAKSLAGTPHGAPVGINGAPDSLPAPAALLPGPWTWCLRPDLAGGQLLDLDPAGQTSPVPADRRILVAGPHGQRFVLWRGVKYPLPDDAALIALGLDGDHPLSALPTWLAALPTGVTLAPAEIAGSGRAAGQVGGHRVTVGQLFETPASGSTAHGGAAATGTDHHYVMTSKGIATASATEAALLAARPGVPAVLRVSATDIAGAPISHDQSLLTTLPDVLGTHALDQAGQAVCLRQQAHGAKLTSQLVVEQGPAATSGRTLLIPPDTGLLAVDLDQLARPNATAQTFLITDQGIAYPLADGSTAAALGLGGGGRTAVPESILGALTHGPLLDPRTAADTVREAGR